MSQFQRAERINSVQVSDIVKMSEAARTLQGDGHNIINLGIGEPDFGTPDHVAEAAIKAIRNGDTNYPPIAGKPALREAVAQRYDGMTAENVLISTGSKYTIYNAFMASLNAGDEVILPAPFWTSYADIVTICGGVPVIVPSLAEDGFRLNLTEVRSAITSRTKWILINSPSNPTGAVITSELMATLGTLLDDFPHCWLMSDEIYEHLTYEGNFVSAYDHLPQLRSRLLVTNGVSKAYAMTGWRVGWGVGPAELINAMVSVQAQGTSGACSIAQAASLAALEGAQDLLVQRLESFRKRRDIVLRDLRMMKGLTTPTPDGAFYTFSSWAGLHGGAVPSGAVLLSDHDFCRYILEVAHVTVIPGSGFAAPNHFRISYACDEHDLQIALERMAEAIDAIKI